MLNCCRGRWFAATGVAGNRLNSRFAFAALFVAAFFTAALALSGCGGATPGEWLARGDSYPIITEQMYPADETVALMKIAPGARVGDRGTILGIIHGWPFPHSDAQGDFGEGLFTYRTDFVVTSVAPTLSANGSQIAMPMTAQGVRKIYFDPARTPVSFDSPASFTAGTPVIADAVTISFAFDQTASTVEITGQIRQASVREFSYKGESITPPEMPEESSAMSGYYSAALGGYAFK